MIVFVCIMSTVVAMVCGGLVTWVAVNYDDGRRARERARLAWVSERMRRAA